MREEGRGFAARLMDGWRHLYRPRGKAAFMGGWPHYQPLLLMQGAINYLFGGVDLTRAISTVQLRQCSPPADIRGWSCEPDGGGITTCSTFDARAFGAMEGMHSSSPYERRRFGGYAEGGSRRFNSFTWRMLFPLDADVLVLATTMLFLNLLLGSWLLKDIARAYGRRGELTAITQRIRRFFASFQPTEVLLMGGDDLAQCVLQIGCAAYTGRVILTRVGVLAHEVHRARPLPLYSHP